MDDNTHHGGQPLTATLHQMSSEGLIQSYLDDNGHPRWTITDLGRTFQALVARHWNKDPIGSRFALNHAAALHEVVTPDQTGKLVVDIGPAIRIYLSEDDAPDYVQVGLLNLVIGEPLIMEEVTPAFPQRVESDIGMARTRPRSKITKAEFELVGGPVQFAGLFDREGRLRCYSALVQWGDGECRAPRWTVMPVEHESEGEQ